MVYARVEGRDSKIGQGQAFWPVKPDAKCGALGIHPWWKWGVGNVGWKLWDGVVVVVEWVGGG